MTSLSRSDVRQADRHRVAGIRPRHATSPAGLPLSADHAPRTRIQPPPRGSSVVWRVRGSTPPYTVYCRQRVARGYRGPRSLAGRPGRHEAEWTMTLRWRDSGQAAAATAGGGGGGGGGRLCWRRALDTPAELVINSRCKLPSAPPPRRSFPSTGSAAAAAATRLSR